MISADIDLRISSEMTTNTKSTLKMLSDEKPVLLVFLRHFGCVFCKEAMADLLKLKNEIIKKNFQIAFVHMAENETAEKYLNSFGLADCVHISDPDCKFYTAFRLTKGSFSQLYGLQTWIRGFSKENKDYKLERSKQLGDSTQMPGIFIIYKGNITQHYIHKFAADRPDYLKLMDSCAIR
jgi:thiol-disulfide isomerase/thioredoxin